MFKCRTRLCILISLTVVIVGHSLGVSSVLAATMDLAVCESEEEVPSQSIEARLNRLEKLIAETEERIEDQQKKADAGGPAGASESKKQSWFKGHEKRMAAWRSALDKYREEQRCWQDRLIRGAGIASDEPSTEAPPESGIPGAGAPVPAPPAPQPQPVPTPEEPAAGKEESATDRDAPVPSAGESRDPGENQASGEQTIPEIQDPDQLEWDCENIRVRYIADRCVKWDSRYAEPCLATERGVYGWPPIFANWVVGIVWPDGVEEFWGRGSWSGAHVTMESDLMNTPDDTPGINRLYDKQKDVWAKMIFGPNGRVISLDDEGWPVVGVRRPPSGSRVPDQEEAEGEAQSVPPPRVALNGQPELSHQLFVDDDGTFELRVKNLAPAPTYDPCRKTAPEGGSIFVQVSVAGPQEFIKPIEPSSFTLEPQEERAIHGELEPFFPELLIHEKDILFGTPIQVQVREESESGSLLFDRSFNVYRFFDVADKEHGDGIVTMARTLADGYSKVVRTRPLDLHVHAEAAVELEAVDTPDFSTSTETGETAFVFDPEKGDKREECSASLAVTTKAGEPVGTLELRGVAEPKNKIIFNSEGLEKTLWRIMLRAQDDAMAQWNPPSYEVHPALVTEKEVEVFDTNEERVNLAIKAERRLNMLFEDVMPGLKFSNSAEPENAVVINWQLRENTLGRPFALGKAFDSLDDPNKNDNLPEIKNIVTQTLEWNRAELAFRLAEAINPSLRKDIFLYPDSMLESHKGFADNTLTLTEQQMINAFAKTAAHEIAHTLSLIHPVQMGVRAEASVEFQRLALAKDLTDQTTFRLSFNGFQTGDLRLGDKLKGPLVGLRSIGIMNYSGNPYKTGIMVYRCARIPEYDKPPEQPVIDGCRGVEAPERTYILQFMNHLGGVDVDLVGIEPATAGTVSNVAGHEKGETELNLLTSESVDVEALIDLPGFTAEDIKLDIMYGGYNDIEGKLRFRPDISIEILRMALAENYTLDDVEKVVAFYRACFWQHERFFGMF